MGGKLWSKAEQISSSSELEEAVEAFTVGNDPQIDAHLVIADCLGTLAHAACLKKAELLTDQEFTALRDGLYKIIQLRQEDNFPIARSQEDCHTAIEQWLTDKYGAVGKKVHTGRSRNDQVLTALRIYTRRKLSKLATKAVALIDTLLEEAKKNTHVPMAGYTHMQPAMPMTLCIFLSAYAESLLDDFEILRNSYALNDQSPLGSAAGFGSALPLDRQYSSQLLGFSRLQINSLYCQNSRGKIEGTVLSALVALQNTMSKLATDLLRFSSRELGFLKLPQAMTTGSSIMPQKRNPDVLELIRAKAANVWASRTAVQQLATNLPSGYNRDYQLLKEPIILSFAIVLSSLAMANATMSEAQWNEDALFGSCTAEIYAADLALEKAQQGVPFRDAYKEAMKDLAAVTVDKEFIKKRVDAYLTIGSMGQPAISELAERLEEAKRTAKAWDEKEKEFNESLLSL